MNKISKTQKTSYFTSNNRQYIESLYQTYLDNPNSLEKEWQRFFEGLEFNLNQPSTKTSVSSQTQDLKDIFRNQGYTYAQLDPLNLTNKDIKEISQKLGISSNKSNTQNTLNGSTEKLNPLEFLTQTYCSTLAVQMNDCTPEQREFLIQEFEDKGPLPQLTTDQKKTLLYQLISVEAMEKFLHSRFVGMKRFSIEGNDTGIIILETILQQASIKEMIVGMTHRGRINVLTNFMGRAIKTVLAEFDGKLDPTEGSQSGDVKYHLGFSTDRKTAQGHSVHISLAFNPSHLESVTPVVAGSTWAKQFLQNDKDKTQVLPVMIHGDAAFAGQGIVYELFQMASLEGYNIGGIIHIIFDNQIGFTTDIQDARSTLYSSDVAKVCNVPVLHVNADSVESAVRATQIAIAYRKKFKSDIVIRHLGYRRHGHNEGDEPMYTQPQMYQVIKNHPTVYQKWSEQLATEGVITLEEAQKHYQNKIQQLQEFLNSIRSEPQTKRIEVIGGAWKGLKKVNDDKSQFAYTETAALRIDIEKTFQAITSPPQNFHWNPKLARQYKKAYEMYERDQLINWSFAEIAAYGTLILEGINVRLTGQDVVRGTFSHRHAKFFDVKTGEVYAPLSTLNQGKADFIVKNSLLSEVAALGFEYGVSTANPWMLTLWEAQFGDFANGAQVIIDQFIVSAEEKWNRMSGIVLLLPHGYEGQGPEHSSARLERYLTQCINNNIQVCYPTTPAQIFHLLRRQQKRDFRKPLIVMAPKSLLRHPQVISSVEELCDENIGFREILSDVSILDPQKVTHLIVCSGKIYYELLAYKQQQNLKQGPAILRLEQIYPFPYYQLKDILEGYPQLKQVLWVQEEPQNMGAFHFVSFYMHSLIKDLQLEKGFQYVGRPPSASPATGSAQRHKIEQEKIIYTSVSLKVV